MRPALATLLLVCACARKDPASGQLDAARPSPAPSARGLPPDGGVRERFYVEVQRVDAIGRPDVPADAAFDRADKLRVTFALTWSGAAANPQRIEPRLLDGAGAPLACADPPGEVRFEPGAPRVFTVTCAAPRPFAGARLAPLPAQDLAVDLELALSGKVPEPPLAVVPPGFRRVAGPGYAFAAPDSWTLEHNPGLVVALYEKGAPEGIRTGVSLTREPRAPDAGDYLRASLEALHRQRALVAVDATKDIVVGGRPMLEIHTSSVARGPSAPRWRTVQWATSAGNAGWVLTCIAPGPVFPSLEPICQVIAHTLVLWPPPR